MFAVVVSAQVGCETLPWISSTQSMDAANVFVHSVQPKCPRIPCWRGR